LKPPTSVAPDHRGAQHQAGAGIAAFRRFFHDPVAQLKDQPARYYNKTVTVKGTVTRSWGLPLVPFQFYNVDDGTGQITVIGHQGRVPPTGSRVDVKGRVQELAAFGGQSLGLHIDESKRKIKY
jgi:hypothetical protein